MDGRRWLILNVALLALMILAGRLALVIHEVGGHAIVARALGAREVRVRLSPLGGGFVSAVYPAGRPPSTAGVAIFDLGGIALNLITGAAAWIGARFWRGRSAGYLALLFFGVGSVAGAIVYLTCGLYYGSGDPVGLSPGTEDIAALQWMWVLFLPAAAGVAWLGTRHYLDFLSGHAPLDTGKRRLGWMLATVGLAGLSYGGLWLWLRNPQIEGSTAKWRLEQEIVRETARRTQAQAVRPPAPSKPAIPAPPPPPVVVLPQEVAHRVPSPAGPIILYATSLASALVGTVMARPGAHDARLPAALASGLAALAALAVFLFHRLG